MAVLLNGVETLPKIQSPEYGATNVTAETTDGRAMIYSERERENVQFLTRIVVTSETGLIKLPYISLSIMNHCKSFSSHLCFIQLGLFCVGHNNNCHT